MEIKIGQMKYYDLCIIMYHYVRPIKNSFFKNIKGLELKKFCNQLDYLNKNYNILSYDEIVYLIKSNKELPNNSLWLTFDDGYSDHYLYVLPELKKRKLKASFFPPANPILNKKLLDVNAIHFILEKINDSENLIESLKNQCTKFGITNKQFQTYKNNIDTSSRFDDQNTIFFKRMLQTYLPFDIRIKIIKNLFEKFIEIDEKSFCEYLYMSMDNIKILLAEGMSIGSHTYNHYWLDNLDYKSQTNELNLSFKFLQTIGANTTNWSIAYPYGAYNKDTIGILKKMKCFIGLTTKIGSSDIKHENLLTLNRFDTNDFPQ